MKIRGEIMKDNVFEKPRMGRSVRGYYMVAAPVSSGACAHGAAVLVTFTGAVINTPEPL